MSLLLTAIWPWMSPVYLGGLSAMATALCQVVNPATAYVMVEGQLHVVYDNLLPAEPLVLRVVEDTRVHFNLILLLSLVAAVPRPRRWLRTLMWGVPLLAVGHLLYLYLFTWVAVWDWVEAGNALLSLSGEDVVQLGRALQERFPYDTKVRLARLYYYMSDFVREGLPLLVWILGIGPQRESETG